MLVLSTLLFFLNCQSGATGLLGQEWEPTLGALTLAAMLVSAPLYLAWVLRYRRQMWNAAQ